MKEEIEMHSRIYQICDHPIESDDLIADGDMPEWFVGSIADYVDDDTDRESDIEWLLRYFRDAVDYRMENQSFVLKPGGKQEIMKSAYEVFCSKAKTLCTTTLDDFSGETENSHLHSDILDLRNAFSDEFSFYTYSDTDSLQTISEWLRMVKTDCRYYIGRTLDYHW